jgi:rubrerythrin
MEIFDSVKDVLDFAIAKEIAAKDFYEGLAERAKNPAMREVFENFAIEEHKHRELLENVKSGEVTFTKQKITDMKLEETTEPVAPGPDMTYQESLVVAMHREKRAFTLYHILAEGCSDAKVRAIFVMLAQEEAKHKLRLELEYDEVVLKEN